MHHNPHLKIDITIKGKIPTYEIQVDVLPRTCKGTQRKTEVKPDAPLYDDGTPDEWPPPDGTDHDIEEDASDGLYPNQPMQVEIKQSRQMRSREQRTSGERTGIP